MPVELKPEQEQRLRLIAEQSGVSVEQLAVNVVGEYLDHIEGLTADVRKGEESGERDGWISNEQVFERLHSRLMKTA